MRFLDRKNKRYGKLTAKKFEHRKGRIWWFCLCDCGNSCWVVSTSLNKRGTNSCGCSKDGNPTHGLSKTPEYKAWKALHQRCSNPNETGYRYYGGRGIKVCKRWDKFENFFKDMGKRPTPKHSVDRKKVDKGYSPSNCRWATVSQQRRNRRDTVYVTYDGKTLSIHDWSDLTGIPATVLKNRYYNGIHPNRLLTKGRLPRQSTPDNYEYR